MALNPIDYNAQKGKSISYYISVLELFFFVLEKIKTFFAEFHKVGKNGKDFKYATQLTRIAHREQVK